jgi:3-hydroxyisobutyrate dehydrogenase-like beta-hydroxyacid dehydrogenase
MLPEGSHVKSAYLTPESGALATSSTSRKLFLDCSTIDATSSLAVGEAVKKSGKGDFADAPVSVNLRNKSLMTGRCRGCPGRHIIVYDRSPR